MEIPTQSANGLPITISCNSGSVEPSLKNMNSSRLKDSPNEIIEKISSVVLNMDEVCSRLKDNDASPSATPHKQLQKNLSHKGSFRGERKAYHDHCKASSCSVEEMKCQSLVVPVCAAEGESRVPKRSRRPCLDPRRVVMIFATVSSIGTMVLIYFTMAIGKINGDDAQAR
ncbi:uncharacterized protein LOC116250525 [Nymphaea colorata]|uniref:uncharacterized protein LOC116250525 n=1 Tax=Nymphaea colorata TaxID=210225 RepID=UPI00129E83E3|nr:uncharacterized protein LOC116250525 [Nymphaea colorata]